jgi:hypothetical protein
MTTQVTVVSTKGGEGTTTPAAAKVQEIGPARQLDEGDPIEPTPMAVPIGRILEYDRNPRRARNEAYVEIETSIRRRGFVGCCRSPGGRGGGPLSGCGRRQHGAADPQSPLRGDAGPEAPYHPMPLRALGERKRDAQCTPRTASLRMSIGSGPERSRLRARSKSTVLGTREAAPHYPRIRSRKTDRPALPQDLKSLRGRMWTLAYQLAGRSGLSDYILLCSKGCGYLVDLPAEPLCGTGRPDNGQGGRATHDLVASLDLCGPVAVRAGHSGCASPGPSGGFPDVPGAAGGGHGGCGHALFDLGPLRGRTPDVRAPLPVSLRRPRGPELRSRDATHRDALGTAGPLSPPRQEVGLGPVSSRPPGAVAMRTSKEAELNVALLQYVAKCAGEGDDRALITSPWGSRAASIWTQATWLLAGCDPSPPRLSAPGRGGHDPKPRGVHQ